MFEQMPSVDVFNADVEDIYPVRHIIKIDVQGYA